MASFGRMPAGYRMSSENNARLAAAGRRYRGGPDPAAPAGPASAPVHGLPGADPASADWMEPMGTDLPGLRISGKHGAVPRPLQPPCRARLRQPRNHRATAPGARSESPQPRPPPAPRLLQ